MAELGQPRPATPNYYDVGSLRLDRIEIVMELLFHEERIRKNKLNIKCFFHGITIPLCSHTTIQYDVKLRDPTSSEREPTRSAG